MCNVIVIVSLQRHGFALTLREFGLNHDVLIVWFIKRATYECQSMRREWRNTKVTPVVIRGTLCCIAWFVFLADGSMADSKLSDELMFHPMASGGGRSAEPQLERAIEAAAYQASVAGDITLSVERITQNLLSDDDVRAELERASVDVPAVLHQLEMYLDAQPKSEQGRRADPDPKVRELLRNKTMNLRSEEQRRVMSCLDVLAAIMEQNDSFASETLLDAGYSQERAREAAIGHFAAQQKKADTELRDIQAKISAVESEKKPQWVAGSPGSESLQEDPRLMQQYRLVVTSRNAESEVAFKGAVSQDGQLTLLVENTPFELELLATRFIALLEVASGKEGISAELFLRQDDGNERKVGGFGGMSGAILEDRRDNAAYWKSGNF
ncbi:hypothetical protein KT71_09142 [Congregibacter litoralis KT71]|uniref:Clp R domain-containing protein n=2 Tax=Congregibacter TaxID=393661 RepID=A4A4Q9_9GAMM|nr:hypothetical protein KT71_09142 [Congregibacter litoralis KT71]